MLMFLMELIDQATVASRGVVYGYPLMGGVS